MSRLLLALLTRFFRLGAAGEEGVPTPDVPAPEASPSEPEDPTVDDLFDGEETPPEKVEPEDDVPTLKARARLLEDQLRQERERASRTPSVPVPQGRDPQEEAEERAFQEAQQKGMDQGYLQTLRWQIDANRTLRKSERSSREALSEAKDIADRTEFATLAQMQPKLYAKYRDQVEQAAQAAKQNGSPVSRMALLDLFVGRAIREGKVTKTVKPKAAAPAAERVDRGRSPLAGARTDISGKEKKSEREARRARLENVRI